MGLFDVFKKDEKKEQQAPAPPGQQQMQQGPALPPRPKGQFPTATGVGTENEPSWQQEDPWKGQFGKQQPMKQQGQQPQDASSPPIPQMPSAAQKKQQPKKQRKQRQAKKPSPPIKQRQQVAAQEMKTAVQQPVPGTAPSSAPQAQKAKIQNQRQAQQSFFDSEPEDTLAGTDSLISGNSLFATEPSKHAGDLDSLHLEEPKEPEKKSKMATPDLLDLQDHGLMEPASGMTLFGEKSSVPEEKKKKKPEQEPQKRGGILTGPGKGEVKKTPRPRSSHLLEKRPRPRGDHPLFIGVAQYVQVLDCLKDIKKSAKDFQESTHEIDDVQAQVLKTGKELHESLDDLHKRIAFIDRIVFEG